MAAGRACGWALGFALACGSAGAEPRAFVDAAACVGRGGHSAESCARGLREARIAFEARAPRFPTRGACEQRFPRCMIGHVFARGGVDFTPAMRGFVFVGEKGAPVAEAALQPPEPRRRETERPQPEPEPASRDAPAAYPVPKALLDDIRERRRRFAGAGRE
jgi:hypothetical protein